MYMFSVSTVEVVVGVGVRFFSHLLFMNIFHIIHIVGTVARSLLASAHYSLKDDAGHHQVMFSQTLIWKFTFNSVYVILKSAN